MQTTSARRNQRLLIEGGKRHDYRPFSCLGTARYAVPLVGVLVRERRGQGDDYRHFAYGQPPILLFMRISLNPHKQPAQYVFLK